MLRSRRRFTALVPAAALVAGLFAAMPSAQATFPGDNGNIVYVSADPPTEPGDWGNADVWLSSPDGNDKVNLTNTPGDYDSYPAVSPDGNTVVFSSDKSGGDLDLYMLDLETLDVSPLPAMAGDEGWSAFSPDGSELVFAGTSAPQSADWELKILDLDTGNVESLNADGWHPNWSPSGLIAYVSQPGDMTDIFTIEAEGGTPVNMTSTSDTWEFGPNWSPDGSVVVYTRAAADFSDTWLVTNSEHGENGLTDFGGWEFEPAWSPDGNYVVYSYDPDGMGPDDSDIHTVNVNTFDIATVEESSQSQDFADWQAAASQGGEKEETTVLLSVKKAPTKTKVTGFVDSASGGVSGVEVKVTYYKKKNGTFKPLQTKEPVTDSDGKFKAAMKRKKPGKCLVTADFYGNAGFEASGAELKFKC